LSHLTEWGILSNPEQVPRILLSDIILRLYPCYWRISGYLSDIDYFLNYGEAQEGWMRTSSGSTSSDWGYGQHSVEGSGLNELYMFIDQKDNRCFSWCLYTTNIYQKEEIGEVLTVISLMSSAFISATFNDIFSVFFEIESTGRVLTNNFVDFSWSCHTYRIDIGLRP